MPKWVKYDLGFKKYWVDNDFLVIEHVKFEIITKNLFWSMQYFTIFGVVFNIDRKTFTSHHYHDRVVVGERYLTHLFAFYCELVFAIGILRQARRLWLIVYLESFWWLCSVDWLKNVSHKLLWIKTPKTRIYQSNYFYKPS